MEFQQWPKTPRLFRDVTITEKIDGTNAAVIITDDGEIGAQSRNRLITPDADNHGFARWVQDNASELVRLLGPGRHFGEWWGQGIQRGYGLNHKRFSLFNTAKWANASWSNDFARINLHVVPEISVQPFNTDGVMFALETLAEFGSIAAPGFAQPEGVCVFHHASRQIFKATLDGDLPKDHAMPEPAMAGNVTPIRPGGVTIMPRDYAGAIAA